MTARERFRETYRDLRTRRRSRDLPLFGKGPIHKAALSALVWTWIRRTSSIDRLAKERYLLAKLFRLEGDHLRQYLAVYRLKGPVGTLP